MRNSNAFQPQHQHSSSNLCKAMTKQLAVEETVRGLPAAVKKQWLEVVWVGGGGLGQPTLEKGPSSTGASANNSAGAASESWVGSVRR